MAGKRNYSISPEGCIDYANQLVELCELPFHKISSAQDINSNFYVSLFEHITGHTIPDLLLSDDSITEVHNIQAVIDSLSLDLLGISLSHLTGEDIVKGNNLSILNLLELFEAVFLHLHPHKKKDFKDKPGTSSGPDNSIKFGSTDDSIQKSESLKSVTSSSDENIPPKRVLKRKICRNTLRKSHPNPHVPKKVVPTASQTETADQPHSKRHSDAVDRSKSPVKRKISKHSSRTVKRPHIEGIEQLHELNFENKVRALLQCEESPILRAQQMRKNYIQSLKTPLKKAPISPCKKSFLLPHSLRQKSKSSIRHSPTRKRTSQRIKNLKSSVPENIDDKIYDAPAFIHSVMEEFPGFKFPKNTVDLLTKQYYHHLGHMHKQLKKTLLKKPTTFIQTEKAKEDEAKLNKILVKDLKEKNFLREINEHKTVETQINCGFRDARLQSAKTRQYFVEFQKSMSRKLQKRNFSEEVLIEKTFKEILNLQKEKIRELCQQVRETDEQDARQHRQYLSALKNLYQEQLALLAESINAEQKDSAMRTKAQKWAIEKMNQEFRKKLQKEVRCLQKDVLDMIEDIHFRELDAQNFIRSFQQQDS